MGRDRVPGGAKKKERNERKKLHQPSPSTSSSRLVSSRLVSSPVSRPASFESRFVVSRCIVRARNAAQKHSRQPRLLKIPTRFHLTGDS